ncbi:MAG TPA: AMP-binding protein [Pseudonocardiaceae bacterium]|nr:AMP-binding protein [Pseudonocardiaceae bacterium]
MRTELIEARAMVPFPRERVWQIIGSPELYPRFVHGISSCEQLSTEGRRSGAQYRIRMCLDEDNLIEQDIQALIYRKNEQIVWSSLQCPEYWLSVQLDSVRGKKTQVTIEMSTGEVGRKAGFGTSEADVRGWLQRAAQTVSDHLGGVPGGWSKVVPGSANRTLMRAGVASVWHPVRGARQLRAIGQWGSTVVGGYMAAAAAAPKDLGIRDERGEFTFGDIEERSTRLANGLADFGIGPRSRVGVLCRNHGGLLESLFACGLLGADVVLMNTGLSAAAVADVIDAHGVIALLADDEFEALAQFVPPEVIRISTWPGGVRRYDSIEDLIDGSPRTRFRPVDKPGRIVVLTSGTSGTPKGARRPTPKGPGAAAAILSRVPMMAGEKMMVAAPLFHTWGLAALQIAMALRASLTLQRKFEPEDTLYAIAEHDCTALIAAPIMLQRILDLPPEVRGRYDLSSLRAVGSAGAALPGWFVTEFMDEFGEILYNIYGSTEVSWASVADPMDLRAAPTTAGRCPMGTRIAILDDTGTPVPPGVDGHIFVGNDMLFDGYTDGARPPVRNDLMGTGDRGYLDADGRLFISGRSDEMIVSGGENVFPRPVEEILISLPQVQEVAVVGVPDDEWGQRLAAYMVLHKGAHLDADSVRSYVHSRLARFAVPRDVFFVRELPRNAIGKVVKRLLVDGTW